MTSFIVTGGAKKPLKQPIILASFPDGEIHCQIPDVRGYKGKKVMVFHRLYPRQDRRILELIFMLNLLKANGVGPIAVFAPYLPYSRQDKAKHPGEALGGRIICDLIAGAGCSELYTLDCHFMKGRPGAKVGKMAIHNLNVSKDLIEFYAKSHQDFEVIGPDKGSSYMTASVAGQNLRKSRGAYVYHSKGSVERGVNLMKAGHVKLRTGSVLLVDDMVSSGGTLLKATAALRELGAKNVACVVTHGLFVGDSLSMLSDQLKVILYTDSARRQGASLKVEDIFWDRVVPAWNA